MKLLLADDHTLFRDALVQYIERAEPDAQVTLAKDLPEVMESLKNRPDQDLILLDLRMPGMDGMKGFKAVRDGYPDVPVALMSGIAEPSDVQSAMNMGAIGYFPKTLSGKALLKAIQLVLTGEKFIPIDHHTHNIMPAYFDDGEGQKAASSRNNLIHMQINDAHRDDVKLTPREEDVISYLLEGAPNKEIAHSLGLQVVTVKLHVRGICRKLNVKNRTQAALKARELGLGMPRSRTY